MNKKVKITKLKAEWRLLETTEQVNRQNMAMITNRKVAIKKELEELGVSQSSARKGALTEQKKVQLIGKLTA